MESTVSLEISNRRKENSQTTINTTAKELPCSQNACRNDLTEPVWKCRYHITITGFIILLFATMHRVLMSVVIVAMVNNKAITQNSKAKSESCADLLPNSAEDDIAHGFKKAKDGEFFWSPEKQGYILGSFYFGHVLSNMPAGRFAERYGCKWITVGSFVTAGIGTVLIPHLSWLSASAVIVIQTVRGFAVGMTGPCVTVLISNWCPKTERGFCFAITMSALSLGPALGNMFSGYVSEFTRGWSYAVYTVGKYALKRPKLPYRLMVTSAPLYALIIGIFGINWAFSQFWLVHSTFLGTILHYPIGQNGLFSAIPFLISFLTSLLFSYISAHLEKKKVFSVNFLRKFWTFMSAILYSLCLLGMYIAGCNRSVSVIFAILSMGSSGLGAAGAVVAVQDMSPMFSGTLLAVGATVGYMASIMIPIIVGFLTNEMQTLEQWNKVFFISIGVVMSSAIIFCIFGSAEIQLWNFVEKENDKTDQKLSKNEENGETTRL